MSTDLEFHRSLPPIRLQSIKIQSSQSSDENSGVIQSSETSVDQAGECRTPTSDEHKIPKILSCPPAPRKPRHAVSCKRKLSTELKFFDVEHREEVDAFFRSSFEIVNVMSRAAAAKRRRPCK